MHQPIVIGPAADAVKPGFEQAELALGKFRIEVLEQKDGGNFLLQNIPREKLIRDLHEKVEIMLFQNLFPELSSFPSQVGGTPSV